MPTAMHPQAKFDPIPPDLDLHELVDRTDNFEWVTRISLAQLRNLHSSGFEKLVRLHVIEGGRPLVLEGWDKLLPRNLFNVNWMESTYDKKQENVRDINAQSDIPMTTGHYLRAMTKLTNQWTPSNFRDERRQRLYLKDIDCPPEWYEQLKRVIPPNVFYMNDNVSDVPSASNNADANVFGASTKTAAVAGDLMSSLPEEMRAQNLMCYIGHEGTYTPAHREMCASLGQNIMVEASGDENGEKPGSSIWFMTETKDRDVVREYFLSMLGHDIEIEKHFAQINAWKKANFPVQVVEQKPGDFILIPPLAPHQVWNRGTRTMKVAWNRTTVETLGMAMREALPKARLVCRDEQYKNKSIIYFTLEKYHKELQSFQNSGENDWLGISQQLTPNNPQWTNMLHDFKQLFGLFTNVLVSEMFGTQQKGVEYIPFDSNITCSYCRSNIFNRFLTCKCCVRPLVNGDEDTYDICMECYAMGRSCLCISGLQFCEQWSWSELVEKHELWRAMIIQQDGFVDIQHSPPPLEIAKRLTEKKTVAQICQEQLKKRPWNDISKPPEQEAPESEPEPEVDAEGRVKKKKPKRKAKKGDVYKCHTCLHKDNVWKLQYCTTCSEAYCYGVLWRAFDIMPQDAMEQEHWQCPKCLGYCNCGSCRRTGHTTPYVPKNTLLGHDTKPIADDRSVEAVVDFRLHNLNWLKNTGEENRGKNTKRMQRLKEKADFEKSKDYLQLQSAAENTSTQDAEADAEASGHDDSQQHAHNPDQHNAQNGHPLYPMDHDGNDTAGSMVPTADMSQSWTAQHQAADADADISNYPDPSMMANGPMLGLGFYEQDDSENRILFDAFDASQAALAGNNDAQVADYVRKTMQQAKRKARLGKDDDPDFRAPKKNYNKKKSETGNLNQLANLDPALMNVFGGGGTTTSTPPTGEVLPVAPQAEQVQAQQEQQEQEESIEPEPPASLQNDWPPTKQPLPIDPLRPTLRHAKPRISYVAPEEPPEDPDDVLPNRQHNNFGRRPKPVPADLPPDAIDQAADAIMGFAPPPVAIEDVAPAEANGASDPEPQRRGRTRQQHDEASVPTTIVLPSRPSPESRKRMRLERVNAVDEDTSMHDADDMSDAEAEWQAVTGAARRDKDGSDSDFRQPKTSAPSTGKKRGRPPKNKALPPPPQNAASEDEDLAVVTPPPAKRRGRPPRKSEPVAAIAPSSVQPTDVQFLSMAERMALKGKKFKIRGRKSMPASTGTPQTASATPQADTLKELQVKSPQAKSPRLSRSSNPEPAYQPELSDDNGNSSSSASSIAAEPSPRKKGPTVVRLNESSGSDDDSDISSGKPPMYVATRGRGRPRGRPPGSGRARGTGRGRGRPRAV